MPRGHAAWLSAGDYVLSLGIADAETGTRADFIEDANFGYTGPADSTQPQWSTSKRISLCTPKPKQVYTMTAGEFGNSPAASIGWGG